MLTILNMTMVVMLSVVILSQIILPAAQGKKLFPMFSSRKREIKEEFLDVVDKIDNAKDEASIEKLKESLNKLKEENKDD